MGTGGLESAGEAETPGSQEEEWTKDANHEDAVAASMLEMDARAHLDAAAPAPRYSFFG